MKKSAIICIVVLSMLLSASTANAESVNPAEWQFTLASAGSPETWASSTSVYTGYPQYDYNWQITEFGLMLLGEGGLFWQDMLDSIPVPDRSGSGTEYSLGFEILDQPFESSGVYSFDLNISVDSDGYGHVSVDNIFFGIYDSYAVYGLGVGGDIGVTAVPEPATIALLGLGALILVKRKRSVP
ncbi:MAG: PEP-CTERM sorting domain-containing protein [Planctomycetota bacterium]|jgi:hypothetical protein